MKRILILTASYGEGHNSAARGIGQGLACVGAAAEVATHDLFIETYGAWNELLRKSYLALINRWPRSWGYVYRWLDRKEQFEPDFRKFHRLRAHLRALLTKFKPDIVVSVFPAYPYLLQQIVGCEPGWRNIVVVTDSITVNAIWYRCSPDYFLVPNEESADVIRAAGIDSARVKVFGFPVSPRFAQFREETREPGTNGRRVVYMINPATLRAVELVRQLLQLDIDLTVTVGRNDKLDRAVRAAAGPRPIQIFGWTDQLPQILCRSHVLIGKAGGATVQEAIAAACPMIINHIVSGQEEGNAQLIAENNAGAIARSNAEVVSQITRAFAHDAQEWREWKQNIGRLSRPRASLEIAEFLMSL